jgi:pyruvate,water dikinase
VQEIESELNDVNRDQIHTVEYASERIQKLIMDSEMPDDIAKAVTDAFAELDAKFVAVRSSATAEDSASAAWAGQLDSFLNTTEATLLRNVRRCFASLFTPRAIFYRLEQGLGDSHVSVAVVVQKMIESEVSGIAFSVHPVTEDHDQIIIEAGFGLGEAIVSGQITPDSYVVSKKGRNILDTNVSDQSRGIFRKEDGGNEWRDLGERGSTRKLDEKQVLELADIVMRIENHYGFPCDIEWAYEGGAFHIVQSRPITTLAGGTTKED